MSWEPYQRGRVYSRGRHLGPHSQCGGAIIAAGFSGDQICVRCRAQWSVGQLMQFPPGHLALIMEGWVDPPAHVPSLERLVTVRVGNKCFAGVRTVPVEGEIHEPFKF
jgi:hypothetical protein